MAIRKTSNKNRPWQVDWREGARRPRRSFRTKREAEDFAREVQDHRLMGVDPSLAQKLTVGDLHEKFLIRATTVGIRGKGPAKAATLSTYRSHWESYIEPRWGSTPLSQVRHRDVAQWLETMTSVSSGHTELAGTSTRREVFKVFKSVLDQGVRAGAFAKNPALDALGKMDSVPARSPRKKNPALTAEQLTRFAELFDNYRSLILLAGTCGPRWGEIAGLVVESVRQHEATPTLWVGANHATVRGRVIVGTPKDDEGREVPIPLSVYRLLDLERAPIAPLFPAPAGGHLRYTHFQERVFTPALKEIRRSDESFPKITFQSLRRTAVSLAISSGANIKAIQRIAGHSSAKTTLDVYSDLLDADMHDSASRVNNLLGLE